MSTELDPTIDPEQAQRAQYVHVLRRLADLIEREALPLPSVPTRLSWYVRGDDPRGDATAIAVALGGEWRADGSSVGSDYLRARTLLAPGEYSGGLEAMVAMQYKRPDPVQQPPERMFAAELDAAAREAREALEALDLAAITRGEVLEAMGWSAEDDGAGPDLRACCDHEHTEPGQCPETGCDCDGDGPTVATDR